MYTTEIENYIQSQLSQVESENKKKYSSFIAWQEVQSLESENYMKVGRG